MRAAGIADSKEGALTYLAALSHDLILPELAEAYVDTGPEMVSWLEANTCVRFQMVEEFPDYHPEFAGGWCQDVRNLHPLIALYPTGMLLRPLSSADQASGFWRCSRHGERRGQKVFCSLAQANACVEHEWLSATRSISLPLFVPQRCVPQASQSPLIVH